MKIKNIQLKNNLILAPMAGVTDVAFRSLAVMYGVDYAVGEMVSAKALSYNNKKTEQLLITAPNEKIKVVQIFGSEPEVMAKACRSKQLIEFDVIDINMGCPAPKIVKNGEGSALMGDIDLAYQIVRQCVEATDKPITVKFRAGFNGSDNAIEFAQMCERAGASAITLHARTREQFYAGASDYDLIKKVKQSVSIPVIGNGDVCDMESYSNMLNTGVDAVMIGRAALGNPELFFKFTGVDAKMSKMEQIKYHVDFLRQHFSERFIVVHMRKHFLWYLKGYVNATALKVEVVKTKTVEDAMSLLENFFSMQK